MQQICEQLRTGGDMSFAEITEVQPWLEFARDCEQDLNADQRAAPRLFKTHQSLTAMPGDCKYLATVREPSAALVSFYTFMKTKGRPCVEGCDGVNDYARRGHFDEDRSVWGTTLWAMYSEFWEARANSRVLILRFESLRDDLRNQIRIIARFLGIPADEELLDKVEYMSSMEFMLQHEGQFDDNFIMRMQPERPGLMAMRPAPKVTPGHKETCSAETKAWLDRMWLEKMTPRTGTRNYAEFCKAIYEARPRLLSASLEEVC